MSPKCVKKINFMKKEKVTKDNGVFFLHYSMKGFFGVVFCCCFVFILGFFLRYLRCFMY